MRSRASFKGHPIHPMLIPFPFAFLTGAFLFDVVAWWTGSMDVSYTARNLTVVGIASGLLAAVPGVIDYFGSVPPKSSGKKRATRHAIANVSALTLFAAAYALREDEEASMATLGAELVGVALLAIAGYMGGTLVYRNQIGVDHRYADAGKWQEVSTGGDKDWAPVARSDELATNQMKLIHTRDSRVTLARTNDGYAAFDDRCTHKGGPLADGVLICGTVQCPWHGSQFDVKTGQVKCGPAKQAIGTRELKESNSEVHLRL